LIIPFIHYLLYRNQPTRITDTSATCIDHICTNCINCPITSAVITHLIADHTPVVQCSFFDEPEVKPAYTCYYSQNKLKNFNEHLSSLDTSNILSEIDLNIATNKFLDIYKPVFELYFQLKLKKRKKSGQNRYDKELKKLLKKDKLYKLYIFDKTIENKARYANIRNLFFRTCKKKCNFYQQKFQAVKQNLKATCQIIDAGSRKQLPPGNILAFLGDLRPLKNYILSQINAVGSRRRPLFRERLFLIQKRGPNSIKIQSILVPGFAPPLVQK